MKREMTATVTVENYSAFVAFTADLGADGKPNVRLLSATPFGSRQEMPLNWHTKAKEKIEAQSGPYIAQALENHKEAPRIRIKKVTP